MADSQPPEGLLRKIAEKLAAANPYDLDWPLPQSACNCGECCERVTRAVLAEIEASGRLLPSGGEVSTQWGALNPRSEFAWAIRLTREDAESEAAALPSDGDYYVASRKVTTWGKGHGQTKLVGPWSPVLSDNSEVPNEAS